VATVNAHVVAGVGTVDIQLSPFKGSLIIGTWLAWITAKFPVDPSVCQPE
jgi:hypothetical protein